MAALACSAAQENKELRLEPKFEKHVPSQTADVRKASAKAESDVDLSQWESVGKCLLEDDLLMLSRAIKYEVDVRRSPDNPNIYCVYEPFKAQYELMRENLAHLNIAYDDSKPRFFFINATDPDHVFISSSPTGENNTSMDNPIATGISYAGKYENLGLFNLDGGAGFMGHNNWTGFDEISLGYNVLGLVSPDFPEGQWASVENFYLVLDYDEDRDLSFVKNWNRLCTAQIEENLFGTYVLQDDKTRTWECDMKIHPNPDFSHLYALINPYAPGEEEIPALTYDGEDHHIIFDARDSEKVYLVDNNITMTITEATGYTCTTGDDIHLLYTANAIKLGAFSDVPDVDSEMFYGTISKESENGVETMLVELSNAIDIAFFGGEYNRAVVGLDAPSDIFRIRAVTTSGIESVVSDAADADGGKAVYYNLQGMRVDNPSAGIYIRRQGNKVEKVAIN